MIEAHCHLRGVERGGETAGGVLVPAGEGVEERHQGQERAGVAAERIACQRLLQQRPGTLPRRRGVLVDLPLRAQTAVPSVEIVWPPAQRAPFLGTCELRLDPGNDLARDFVLQREHVAQRAIITLRPELLREGRVAEPCRDAHTIAGAAHAALDDVARTQHPTGFGRA